MSHKLIPPTDEEDAAITAAALSDPDNPPLTPDELAQFRPMTFPHGNRKKTARIATTIRLDADLLAALKATGPDWRSRLNDMVREWVRTGRV
jgi:uncharacterized protein (DUF4415 family)